MSLVSPSFPAWTWRTSPEHLKLTCCGVEGVYARQDLFGLGAMPVSWPRGQDNLVQVIQDNLPDRLIRYRQRPTTRDVGSCKDKLRRSFGDGGPDTLTLYDLAPLGGLDPIESNPDIPETPSLQDIEAVFKLRASYPQEDYGPVCQDVGDPQVGDLLPMQEVIVLARCLGLIPYSLVKPGGVQYYHVKEACRERGRVWW